MHRYFWKCCDMESDVESLSDARGCLESHEKENHKGKPVGSFGIEYDHDSGWAKDGPLIL